MIYIHLYGTAAEHDAVYYGPSYEEPWLALQSDTDTVTYNSPHTPADDYLTFSAIDNGTFSLSTNASFYSVDDGETWTELPAGESTPQINAGQKVLWKAEITPTSSAGVGTFSATGDFDVTGNPLSMLYGDNYRGVRDLTGKDHAFKQMFKNNTHVVNASEMSLAATTLSNGCYESMFEACTSLVTAPELPAMTATSQCYKLMFATCRSLLRTPALPATTLAYACYDEMFAQCSSLTSSPELPATQMAQLCYYGMFSECSSLTTPSVLHSTQLEIACYFAMYNSTAIEVAPALPAASLPERCYMLMFYGCPNLRVTPDITVTGDFKEMCFRQMYQNSPNVSSVRVDVDTTISYGYAQDWLTGCAPTGTVYCRYIDTQGSSSVLPSGWTQAPLS